MRRSTLIGLVFLMSLSAWGCRASHSPRRAALLAYAVSSRGVNARQSRFLAAWQQSRQRESAEELRATGREHVLPALTSYVDALAAMALPLDDLHEPHTALVAAWREFETHLARYYERVELDTLDRHNSELEDAWVRLSARILAYRRTLHTLFAAAGLGLTNDFDLGGP